MTGGNASLRTGVGGLFVNAPANIVSLASDSAELIIRESGDTLIDQFIFAGRAGSAIDKVWVRGQQVVSHGRHYQRDKIAAAFRTTLRSVLSSTTTPPHDLPFCQTSSRTGKPSVTPTALAVPAYWLLLKNDIVLHGNDRVPFLTN
jgi:hypothetical protein